MSLNEIYEQRYAQTQKDKALARLDREIAKYERKCECILKHRIRDWEKRHLIWKHKPTFDEPKKPVLADILYKEPMIVTVGLAKDMRYLLG